MTLVLKPRGRGRWTPMTIVIEKERGGLLVRVGQLLVLGGITWRVCAIGP